MYQQLYDQKHRRIVKIPEILGGKIHTLTQESSNSNSSIESISIISNQAAVSSNSASSYISKQLKGIEQVSINAVRLTALADDLYGSINKFNL